MCKTSVKCIKIIDNFESDDEFYKFKEKKEEKKFKNPIWWTFYFLTIFFGKFLERFNKEEKTLIVLTLNLKEVLVRG